MQTFTAVYMDQDGDFTSWNVAGLDEETVLRAFLQDMCPEQEAELSRVDGHQLRAWAEERECFAEVVPH